VGRRNYQPPINCGVRKTGGVLRKEGELEIAPKERRDWASCKERVWSVTQLAKVRCFHCKVGRKEIGGEKLGDTISRPVAASYVSILGGKGESRGKGRMGRESVARQKLAERQDVSSIRRDRDVEIAVLCELKEKGNEKAGKIRSP